MTINAAKISARYPGRCLCGNSFNVGAAIYWDGSVRRATGCPACAPRKAIVGESVSIGGGLMVRFDRHPDTGAVILCQVTETCGAFGAFETYALMGGVWKLRATGREAVLTNVATHDQIESWRTEAAA
jgi:hypothetical protein